jgi:zinc finger SWIM domain-containing protein 3
LEIKPERWSDAFFKGSRHGQYSCNIFGTVMEWLPTRYELSVVQLVDTIRCRLMEMMYTQRESSNAWTGILTPAANQKLQEEVNKAHTLNVIPTEADDNGNVFKVCDDSVNVVNLDTCECTCQRWHISGLPCMHAIAVFERTGQFAYDYCVKYFTMECYRLTYAMSINPIPDVIVPATATLIDPTQSPATIPCPMRTRRRVGRPKEKPADPRIAIKRAVRCSRCKGYGHNKATCKVPISA